MEKLQGAFTAFILFVHIFCVFFSPKGIMIILILMYTLDQAWGHSLYMGWSEVSCYNINLSALRSWWQTSSGSDESGLLVATDRNSWNPGRIPNSQVTGAYLHVRTIPQPAALWLEWRGATPKTETKEPEWLGLQYVEIPLCPDLTDSNSLLTRLVVGLREAAWKLNFGQ